MITVTTAEWNNHPDRFERYTQDKIVYRIYNQGYVHYAIDGKFLSRKGVLRYYGDKIPTLYRLLWRKDEDT